MQVTYAVLLFILIRMLFSLSILQRLLLKPLRQLLDIEEAGATDNILLKGVIDKLVLVLEHAGMSKGLGGHQTRLEFKIQRGRQGTCPLVW